MKTNLRNLREILRDEMVMRDRIASLLKEGNKTIPELVEALGTPGNEVVCWLMGMRRYGLVEEVGRPNEDGYFEYCLTEGEA